MAKASLRSSGVVKSTIAASVAGQYIPMPKPINKLPKTKVGKSLLKAKTTSAKTDIAADARRVFLRPQRGESAPCPPKNLPTTPETEPLPKARPTKVDESPT